MLDGLRDAVAGLVRRPDWSAWVTELQDTVRAAVARDAELLGATADPIHPARIYGELVPRLADDAIVIGDGGDFVSFAGKYVEPKRPGGWLDPGPYGCLGAGLGAAIAARIARPSAQVVLLYGDGAAGMSLMDVDTLVRHDLPVVMVCGNNSAWGLEKGPMQMLYGYDVAADLAPQTRYDEVVRALGGAGETVTDPREIGPALDRAFAANVPYLVNVITDVDARLPPRHLRHLSKPPTSSSDRSVPRSSRRSVGSPARSTSATGSSTRATATCSSSSTRRDALARPRCGSPWPAGSCWGSVTFCAVGSPYREIARDDEGEFRMLAVDPAARGRGVGRALVELCLRRSRVLGYAGVRMSSMDRMTDAHRVYERLGFTRVPADDWEPQPGVLLLAYGLRFTGPGGGT